MKWNEIYDQLKKEREQKRDELIAADEPAAHEVQLKFLEIAFSVSEDLITYSRI